MTGKFTILDLSTPDGTYSEPVCVDNLSCKPYSVYANTYFTSYPDLELELINNTVAGNGIFAIPWILFGTHKGPVGGYSACCQFIADENGKVLKVIGCLCPE